jgi:hypothetical protein
MYALTF